MFVVQNLPDIPGAKSLDSCTDHEWYQIVDLGSESFPSAHLVSRAPMSTMKRARGVGH
jgi:hypothetical protein